ncbi:MAG: hypothetical protein FWD21_04930 [Peptococcaceae bacterium]|nr:hypothetical protein [Peptococcaceae bacterium]
MKRVLTILLTFTMLFMLSCAAFAGNQDGNGGNCPAHGENCQGNGNCPVEPDVPEVIVVPLDWDAFNDARWDILAITHMYYGQVDPRAGCVGLAEIYAKLQEVEEYLWCIEWRLDLITVDQETIDGWVTFMRDAIDEYNAHLEVCDCFVVERTTAEWIADITAALQGIDFAVATLYDTSTNTAYVVVVIDGDEYVFSGGNSHNSTKTCVINGVAYKLNIQGNSNNFTVSLA